MGKSRFEGMEIAVREQAKIASLGISDKIEIEELEEELNEIDNQTELKIKELKLVPVDKELVKSKLESYYKREIEAYKEKTEDNKEILRQQLESERNSFEKAKKRLEELETENEKDIKRMDIQLERELEELKERHTIELSKLDNTDKTLELQEEKIKLEGEKKKQSIKIKLNSLKARDKVNDEQKKAWEKLYQDTVEMSKISQS